MKRVNMERRVVKQHVGFSCKTPTTNAGGEAVRFFFKACIFGLSSARCGFFFYDTPVSFSSMISALSNLTVDLYLLTT